MYIHKVYRFLLSLSSQMPNHLIIDPGTAHLHLHLHQTDKIKTLFTPTKSGDVVTATGNRGQTSLFPISKSKKKKTL